MNHDQKETSIETIRTCGTMKTAAESAGVSVGTLNNEMKRSAIFKKRVLEAKEEGKRNLADNALQLVKDYVDGKYEKTDRNRLTAALALLNWAEPGFRGTTQLQGKIEHDVRIISAVPRPKYKVTEPERKLLDTPKKLIVKSRRTGIKDDNGNSQSARLANQQGEVVDGEVVGEVVDEF